MKINGSIFVILKYAQNLKFDPFKSYKNSQRN